MECLFLDINLRTVSQNQPVCVCGVCVCVCVCLCVWVWVWVYVCVVCCRYFIMVMKIRLLHSPNLKFIQRGSLLPSPQVQFLGMAVKVLHSPLASRPASHAVSHSWNIPLSFVCSCAVPSTRTAQDAQQGGNQARPPGPVF
jgi:hypothetical protein